MGREIRRGKKESWGEGVHWKHYALTIPRHFFRLFSMEIYIAIFEGQRSIPESTNK